MAINKKIADLNEMFSVFDNPIDKYSQLIELGKNNSGISTPYKNESNRISGCASMAWIITRKKNNQYYISIDSDTFIVRGLLNILKIIIDGEKKDDIFQLKIENILKNIGMEESITSQRTNGFISALDKIKKQIEKINGK
jgi:cysteine desulfuration protein SufE